MSVPMLGPGERIPFPDPGSSSPEGILCYGGNLSPGMLLSAYEQGVFPWYNPGEPILWWSPDPRFIVRTQAVHLSTSMRKLFKKRAFEVSYDQAFRRVMEGCRDQYRPGQGGTWIGEDMLEAYVRLHELGYAHSVEVWKDGELAGGLYGVGLGRIFFGESMFTLVSNASKYGFLTLAESLRCAGFPIIDSQVHTNHLASLGGVEIPRQDYLIHLESALQYPTLRGNWEKLLEKRFSV